MLFQYTYLARGAIRLVRFHPRSTPSDIHLTLEHQENYSSGELPYTVLSYPHSKDESKSLTLHGRTRMVPAPVWDALSAIQVHGDAEDRYWVDAICVNQRDETEKQEHAAQMEQIYSSAHKVLAWCGEEDGYAEQVFGSLRKKADHNRMDNDELDDQSKDAVGKLLQTKFSAQDQTLLRQAKHIELMSGRYRCDMGLMDHNLQANASFTNPRPSSHSAL
ncbi:Heterokaryon incompatibility protein 6, OR allele [Pseudocercospora fuligena]|uniref:Heterokaryon incompatibility protein 6, OR allele n=1 Tax=Pseudocercospora fuligena TaxID=685502 RepID=A0A8H6RQC4_9PEZI|nr:Heterokaryon incompatibility protein 6, OR allele [Pseudocercospora fuligena]